MHKWAQHGQAEERAERLTTRRRRLQALLEDERTQLLLELQGQQASPATQRKTMAARAKQIEARKESERQQLATERATAHMHDNNAAIQAATRVASARIVHEERQAQVSFFGFLVV